MLLLGVWSSRDLYTLIHHIMNYSWLLISDYNIVQHLYSWHSRISQFPLGTCLRLRAVTSLHLCPDPATAPATMRICWCHHRSPPISRLSSVTILQFQETLNMLPWRPFHHLSLSRLTKSSPASSVAVTPRTASLTPCRCVPWPRCRTPVINGKMFYAIKLLYFNHDCSLFLFSCSRNRSLSMSAIGTSLPINLSSPLRSREHTSEAGSPTLEQVLLMSKTKSRAQSIDYGYGSMMQDFSGSGDGLYTSFLPSSYKETQTVDQDPYTQQTGPTMRPSFREIEAVDIAVAEAVHNLQTLKQKQVALYSEFKTPVSTLTPAPSQSSFSTGKVQHYCIFCDKYFF